MTRRPFTHGSFTIERTCNATPERIFRAFSEQAAKHRWFACHDDWPVLAPPPGHPAPIDRAP